MALKAGYKQSEVGVIPEDWEVRPFTRTLRIGSGQVDPRRDEFQNMILIAPDHLSENTGRLISKITASEQGAKSGKYRFFNGDIIYSKIRPYLNKVMIARFDGLCSADMYPLTPHNDCDCDFIFYCLLSSRFVEFASSVSVRNAIPKINRVELAQFSFALPSIQEQCTISAVLNDADALINSLEVLISKKRGIKRAATQQLLTGRTRLPGFGKGNRRRTELGDIPEDWHLEKIDDVLDEISMGPFGSNIKVSNFVSSGVPVLSGDNIRTHVLKDDFKNFVTYEKAKSLKKAVASRGDVIVTHRGTIGQIAHIPDSSEYEIYVISQSQFRARFTAKVNPAWVVLFFLSDIGAEKLLAGKGHTGVPAIAQATTTFRKLHIPLPSRDEQAAIVEVISDMDAELTALEHQRDKARALRLGMMQELLTGRIRLV